MKNKTSSNTGYIAELHKIASELAQFPSHSATSLKEANTALPSVELLGEIMKRLRGIFFPEFFGKNAFPEESLAVHTAANLDSIYKLLAGQIVAGLCFECGVANAPCSNCHEQGQTSAWAFIKKLPAIRELLAGDASAAFEGDPAAKSVGETIFCYPSILAMFHHRIAHELYSLKVPVIPRIIAEMAHSKTGIDIHPGASIGKNFFIDHGTGVVIGETTIVGCNCRLYQGVTLGALSFPKNKDGTLTKGNLRHPILEDNVTVYAGATILGRITIGSGSVIGGNTWITQDVPPNSVITQKFYDL